MSSPPSTPADDNLADDTEPERDSLRKGTILRGSSALSASVLVVAVGGALFWAIAARVASSEDVGRVAALSSTMAFLVYLTALGLVPVVARYGSGNARAERVVYNRASLVAIAASATGAVIISIVGSAADVEILQPVESVIGTFAFAIVAASSAFTVLVEIHLLSQGRYRWIVGRAILAAVVSVALVARGPVEGNPLALFLAGPGVAAASGLIVWTLSEGRHVDRFAIRPVPDDVQTILRYLSVSWTGSLVSKAAPTALPLVVALSVSSDANASFFVAWNIALVIFVIIQNLGTTLLADGGRTSTLEGQTRHALLLGIGVATLMVIVTQFGSPLVERVYGTSYADSVDVLRVLVLAAVPLVFYAVAFAVAQVRHLSRAMLGLPLVLTTSVYLPLLVPGNVTVMSAAVVWVVGVTIAGAAGIAILVVVTSRSFTPSGKLAPARSIPEG